MDCRNASAFAILVFLSVTWASKTCLKSVDVALVVEDSSALPNDNAETSVKNFLTRIANHFTLSDDNARVAFQLYNDKSQTVFNLNKYTENADAEGAILMTQFSHKVSNAPSVGSALNYTLNNILTVENGERSCYPTVVILLSYSSGDDPNGNGKDSDLSLARQLRNLGALILCVGVGSNRNPALLIGVAGGASNYYDVADFSDLSDSIADDISSRSCKYEPLSDFYSCDTEINADLIFVVDVSKKMNVALSQAVVGFISNFLRSFRFGKNDVQAALVTYSKVADIAIPLTSISTYDKFIQKVNGILADGFSGTERYIYNALDTVLYHVMTDSAGFRPHASRSIFVFAADCFTGPDPTTTAQAIRDKSTNLYLISLGSPLKFWKETLDITGDPRRLYEVPYNADVILPNFLSKVASRELCPTGKTDYMTTKSPPSTSIRSTTAEGTTYETSTKITTAKPTTKKPPPTATWMMTNETTLKTTTTPPTTRPTTTKSTSNTDSTLSPRSTSMLSTSGSLTAWTRGRASTSTQTTVSTFFPKPSTMPSTSTLISSSTTLRTTTSTESPQQCDKIDLIFVLEESESVNERNGRNFDTLKDYLVNLTSIFNINQEFTRVAAIGYARTAMVHFHLFNSNGHSDLTRRIRSAIYINGARNVSGGLQEAAVEITKYARQDAGVPVYLVHVVEYAHDVGDDPVVIANVLGVMKNVTMFTVSITNFQYDFFFDQEIVETLNAVGRESKQFNASSYTNLYGSGLHATFREIIQKFSCATFRMQ